MKTKKIVQVVPGFNVGGAEALVKEYLINFKRNQYDAEALVLGLRKNTVIESELEKHHVKVTYLPELYTVPEKAPKILKKVIVAYRWRAALKRYVKKTSPDIIHFHLSVANRFICAAQSLKHAKFFYTVHSDPDKYWANGENAKERKAILKLVQKRDMQMIALHMEQEAKIRKYYGDDCKIHVLHNAIDVKAYEPTPQKRKWARDQIGVSEDSLVIGHVGRFLPVKNHEFLLEVFESVKKKCPHAVLCLVGDGELKDKIQARAEKQFEDGSVVFLGNRGDVPQIMSAFDAFVLPSIWEGFPITLIEAQAAHISCFVSDVINHEVKLTSLVSFLSLEGGVEHWADEILKYKSVEYNDICLNEYDINTVLAELVKLYGI